MPNAETITPSPEFYQVLLDCTGSRERWSDVMLKAVFTRINNGKTVTFEQWPSFLGQKNWEDIVNVDTFESFSNNYILAEVILHELMHTVGIPNPISIPLLLIYCVFSLDANDEK